MTTFVVHGPFEVKYEKRKGGRILVFDDFWSTNSRACYLSSERGCYVFAIRNRGLTPIYVGQATQTFKQETFNNTNKHKYHNGFSDYGKGTPVMYFVVHAKQKGRTNERQIEEIEDFLIPAGFVKNPDIQNVKGIQQPGWKIKGVVRSGSGKRNKSASQFIKLFDLNV